MRKARESLERAIGVVEKTTRWQAHVVYGDTDSLFVHLPGRTKDQAFVIGQEIADTITNMFPKPMKLRFEKVRCRELNDYRQEEGKWMFPLTFVFRNVSL